MLYSLSKYIFFILILSFLSVLYLYITKKYPINTNFLYLFWILLIPFFDKIINFIKKDFSFNYTEKIDKYLFLKIFILIILIIILIFFKVTIINFATLFFIIFAILFKLDPRLSFLLALFLLCYTVLFILIEDKKIAEQLSIYAYYFLIIWVWLEITENLFFKKIENEK